MVHSSTGRLDIQNAFLHGALTEDVFVSQPPGFINSSFPSHVCKLNRSLYGLKQAPRAWFAQLSDSLISMGFASSPTDDSLFSYRQGSDLAFILVYVDDLLVITSNPRLSASFLSVLSRKFPVKDLGLANYFLGIEITRDSSGFHLCQSKHIMDLITKTGMTNSKPVSTPMATNFDPLEASPVWKMLIYTGAWSVAYNTSRLHDQILPSLSIGFLNLCTAPV